MKDKSKYWYRRNPGKFLLLLVLAFALVSLSVTEILLRMQGFVPGQLSPEPLFHAPETVKVKSDYFTDELGIMRVNPEFADKVGAIVRGEREIQEGELDYSLEQLARQFRELRTGELKDVELAGASSSPYLQEYLKQPINAEGFRSLPFDTLGEDSNRVLLLGDSFTWGLAADPIPNSFADRLLARGYQVYNTGIIGTDPANYLAIAQEYIPRLRPSVVILNFFLGNDQMDYSREPDPKKSIIHVTNFGWLSGFVNGCYVSPEQSLQMNPKYAMLPDSGSFWLKACGSSVLGTRLWKLTGSSESLSFGPQEGDCLPKFEPQISENYIRRIEEICYQHGARLEVALIPNRKALPGQASTVSDTYEEMVAKCFPNEEVHTFKGLEQADFAPDDDHFNNAGMEKWADFLEGLINRPEEQAQ